MDSLKTSACLLLVTRGGGAFKIIVGRIEPALVNKSNRQNLAPPCCAKALKPKYCNQAACWRASHCGRVLSLFRESSLCECVRETMKQFPADTFSWKILLSLEMAALMCER